MANKSFYLNERELIRTCRPLNKVLFENRYGLEYIFKKEKGKDIGLSKTKCINYIQKVFKSKFSIKNIFKHYVYSLDTIQDEFQNIRKYQYLKYVEFLEFLCRIA